jgi:peptidoglycan/LPS O-acetylase OafA/YrhL
MPPDKKKEQFDALTGLRGFAALWVVSLHFQEVTNQLLPISVIFNWLTGSGANAVAVFFILSGFVLLYTYEDRFNIFSWREYRRYLGLRLARIYPGYLAALLAMVGLVALAAWRGLPRSEAAYPLHWLPWEALMMHQWWRADFFGWNFPDWSVSAEWFAYLFIFPVAVLAVKKIHGVMGGILAVAVLLVAEPAIRLHWVWKIPMVSLLFLAGAFLWEVRRHFRPNGGLLAKNLDLTGVVLLLAALTARPFLTPYAFLALVLIAASVLILGLTFVGGLPARVLASPAALFLGEISYSVYLIHGVVLRLLKVILPVAQYADASLVVRNLVVIANYAAVIVAATILYYGVEHPARVWLRRKFESHQS